LLYPGDPLVVDELAKLVEAAVNRE
jgi:hypothetical protein